MVIREGSKVGMGVWKKNMVYSALMAFSSISNNRMRKSSLWISCWILFQCWYVAVDYSPLVPCMSMITGGKSMVTNEIFD